MIGWPLIISLAVLPLAGSNVASETVFFLVGQKHQVHNDSYILPLSDPEDIATARILIEEKPLLQRDLVVAEVMRGADGINRNYVASGAPRWSWHISRFFGFAENTIETMDGYPGGLEKGEWTGPIAIGFWNYTVVSEFDPAPLVLWSRTTESGAELSWMDLGTNYVYTVETSTTFDSPEWVPAEGQTWPIAGTNWVDTSFSPQSAPRMYRVRAEKEE